MPKRVIAGFVSSKAFNSSIHENPFYFQNFGHTNILLSSDSHNYIRPIKSDFANKQYLQAYLSLFEALGIFFSDSGILISRKDYPNCALVAWDLTSDLSASADHLSLPQQGSLNIDITFAKPIEESICMILFSEFDNIIEVDSNRAISIDYSS